MSQSFSNLRKKMRPSARAASEKKAKELLDRMPLQALRQALDLSQEELATLLAIKQPNVSKIEQRTDMYISTLRNYIEAMGGELDVVAKFPQGEVHIDQFRDYHSD